MKRTLVMAAVAAAFFVQTARAAEPAPGIGLLIKPNEMAALREKIKTPPFSEMYAKIVTTANVAVTQWPKQRESIAPRLGNLLDLSVSDNVTKDPEDKKAGEAMRSFAMQNMCPAAFVYMVSGDTKYAQAAWDIFQHMAKVNRWGWFPWDGANMPQIDAGMDFRDAAFTLDFIWDYLTPEQRKQARDVIAEKCAEPYYRLVLHSPAMGLHHLRSKNQGNNVLAGAMIACLALGDDYPEARVWLNSYIQTFSWLVTHDIGWAGQHLEAGGYWTVSMQNLYTAATCLANVKAIDFRGHPGFMEATFNPIYHQSTVPPCGMMLSPISSTYRGAPGVIAGKGIELPAEAHGGAWWYDYASRFPQSAALYFINQAMVSMRQGKLNFFVDNPHQTGHFEIIGLLWAKPELYQPQAAKPADLFKTTDRMSMFRSGYGIGQTYLYFNGDIFLSAMDEILVTTSSLSWHYKWHGWQKAESGMETQDEPLAPSMVVKKSSDDADFAYTHTVSGTSNITYYMPDGQNDCYKHYTQRDRDILYVCGPVGSDYFVFIDRVAQNDPRWHGVLWQTWNNVHENKTENYGRYKIEGEKAVRLERPNADLALQFAAPAKVTFEVEAAPGMPIVSYMYDHNMATLRALAGAYGPVQGDKVTVTPTVWKGKGEVVPGAALGQGAPAAAYRVVGKANMVGDKGASLNGFEVAAPLVAGQRYRMSMPCHKELMDTYGNTCWQVALELVDSDGKVVAQARGMDLPSELSITDPRSITKTTPWLVSDPVYFDVPQGAKIAKIRGKLFAAEWTDGNGHAITAKSIIDLGELTIEPVGEAQRTKNETFVTIATPLKKGTPMPAVTSKGGNGEAYAKVPHAGAVDHIVVCKDKAVSFDGGSVKAGVALIRVEGGKVTRVFAQDATSITLGDKEFLASATPVDVSARLDASGKVTWIRVNTAGAADAKLQGQSVKLSGGLMAAGADLNFAADPAGAALVSNSVENQRLLKAGLEPLIKQIDAQRDELTAKGAKNIALGAKVTASGVRDERFKPELVIDNKTWEYPADGLLDYTQGELKTSPMGGYGQGDALPLYGDNMSLWAFYVRPTYWLLPYGQTGWLQLELAQESPVKTVRLLNTSNAGCNDYATMKYHVELLNTAGKVLATQKGEFGKLYDRPFKQAFFMPTSFKQYGGTFKGMLEPGIKVPFGDGWQTVDFADAPKAKFVKVYIDSFWAIGGGLNEIQVYAK